MKIRRNINIEESIYEKLKELAKKENRSISNYVEILVIREYEKKKI